jgi:prepilin-type N-terminal cleavage/methylation domain-containing protein
MSNKLKELRAKEGFTIIEVIIVLVIGAVIMLAVFLVVPQLQRTQRNSRAQAIARQVLSAGEQFAANNNQTYPTCAAGNACTNITNITGDLKNGAGTAYSFVTAAPATSSEIAILNVGECGTNPTSAATYSGKTKFIVVVPQENNTNTPSTYCLSN